MAAGDEALPLQGGQDVPQLRAADTQLLGKNALPGETAAVGVLSRLHGLQQILADGPGGIGVIVVGHTRTSQENSS